MGSFKEDIKIEDKGEKFVIGEEGELEYKGRKFSKTEEADSKAKKDAEWARKKRLRQWEINRSLGKNLPGNDR